MKHFVIAVGVLFVVNAADVHSQTLPLGGDPCPDFPTLRPNPLTALKTLRADPNCARRVAEDQNGSPASLLLRKEQLLKEIMDLCLVDQATAEKAMRGKLAEKSEPVITSEEIRSCVIGQEIRIDCEYRIGIYRRDDNMRRQSIAAACLTDVLNVERIEGDMPRLKP